MDGRYALDRSSVRFVLGAYDHRRELVIDPLLVYGTYLGGSFYNYGTGIAGGWPGFRHTPCTRLDHIKPTFPPTTPSTEPSAAKPRPMLLSSTRRGQHLSTPLISAGSQGGAQTTPYDITVDSQSNVYVAGTTSAPDYPATPGAYQPICAPIVSGTPDCFKLQLVFWQWLSDENRRVRLGSGLLDILGRQFGRCHHHRSGCQHRV